MAGRGMRERPVDLVVLPEEDAAGHRRLALALGMLATGAPLERVARVTGLGGRELSWMVFQLAFGLTEAAAQLEELEAREALDDEA